MRPKKKRKQERAKALCEECSLEVLVIDLKYLVLRKGQEDLAQPHVSALCSACFEKCKLTSETPKTTSSAAPKTRMRAQAILPKDWRPVEKQRSLVRSRGDKARCEGCRQVKPLRPYGEPPEICPAEHTKKGQPITWVLKSTGEVWTPTLYCTDCMVTLMLNAVEQVRAERATFETNLAKVGLERTGAKLKRKAKAKSLVEGEGTLAFLKRMLSEGATKKEIRRAFRKIYHERGKTDEKWIRVRVRKYMHRPEIREFVKQLKKEKKK